MKVTVRLNSTSAGKILIDGVEVPCRDISYHASVGARPEIILELVGDIEIDGDTDVKLKLPDGKIFNVKELSAKTTIDRLISVI